MASVFRLGAKALPRPTWSQPRASQWRTLLKARPCISYSVRYASSTGPAPAAAVAASSSTAASLAPGQQLLPSSQSPGSVDINGREYKTDSWFNVPSSVAAAASRRLHLQKDHPLSITRQIIEAKFPAPTFRYYNEFGPVVSTFENFDSLGFAADHPGRARSDTYYINKDTLLRTHTSAHELELFRRNSSDGYMISADVYRRDEIDRTHYPVFHQMEGARVWDRSKSGGRLVTDAVYADLAQLPEHGVEVQDPNPPFHPERNPLQKGHDASEAQAVVAHLKRSLELMIIDIFTRAKAARKRAEPNFPDEPLRVRWVEAFFPFTSPSWEMEVYYGGDWLEVLGCGVTQQQIHIDAGVPSQVGWAFGLGLDRLAMLLFQIPDIRLFWSQDQRFLSQFEGVSDQPDKLLRPFKPFSKYPSCSKDVSFWLPHASSAAGGAYVFHENDFMEIVRDLTGNVVEDVRRVDEFVHPHTGRRSMCYRINYRSWERTLTNEETNDLHSAVTSALVDRLGVEIR